MDYLQFFLEQNPWQQGKKISIRPYIKRNIYDRIYPLIERDEIITLTGPRQAGKTTILLKLIETLLKQKKIPANCLYYFNFDQEELQEEFKKPEQLYAFVKNRGSFDRYFVFIDEAQRLVNAGIYLKALHDLPLKPFKLIVSGSSSLQLRAKTREYLTGRHLEYTLYPLSFAEIISEFGFISSSPNLNITAGFLKDLAVFGGYPKPFSEKNPEIKQKLLFALYKDYVQKDIRDFAGIEKVVVFNKLTALLAYQIGNLISREELACQTQADVRTIEKYLEILEETYVVKLLKPFFVNRRKEIAKSPKIYFLDNGFRNAQLSNFSKYEERPDKGQLFENLVVSELIKQLPEGVSLNYWRTQAGAEVDFIIIKGNRLIPVEVKSNLSDYHINKSLKSFISSYSPEIAFMVSEKLKGESKFQRTAIKFIPFSEIEKIYNQ